MILHKSLDEFDNALNGNVEKIRRKRRINIATEMPMKACKHHSGCDEENQCIKSPGARNLYRNSQKNNLDSSESFRPRKTNWIIFLQLICVFTRGR